MDTIEIRRVHAGEAALAQKALQMLIPEDERGGKTPSVDHLQSLLKAQTNCLILALQHTDPVGFTIAYREM